MCGIAGIFDGSGQRPINTAELRRMTAALRHRGPDGDGFHLGRHIGLGHRRLAILDIEGGMQPMYNEDGTVAVVFNGEIYNHSPLREALRAHGHTFHTRSDTETIVHGWEQWGADCLHHLAGMFAFALWDARRRELFLARDRLGKKPLYYAHTDDGGIVFASELCSLATVSGLHRELDAASVDDFFALGYVPDPHSIYSRIRKLPPAHFILLRAGTAVAAPVRYWQPGSPLCPVTEADAVQTLIERLNASVATRLIADVPLGAFLSGGVDSSAVVALAASQSPEPLRTFAIGFRHGVDERPYADLVARRYATLHRDTEADVDWVEAARTQADIFGEPFGDTSSVPTHEVCALARRHVTVALSGDGGDELLAGYRRYRWHVLAESVRRHIPASLRRRVLGRLARAYPKLDRAPRWLRARYTLTEISLDSAAGYYRTICRVHRDRRRALFSREMLARLDGYDPADRFAALMDEGDTDDPLAQAQYVDLATWLPGDILTKVDRTSMASSLEARAPLLDHSFVEWAMSLPPTMKLRGREGKYIFKRALEPLLPREVLYRRKQGFTTPLTQPFRRSAERVRKRLLGEIMLDSGLFRGEALAQLVHEHATGQFDHAQALWQLLVFEGFLARQAAMPLPVREPAPPLDA